MNLEDLAGAGVDITQNFLDEIDQKSSWLFLSLWLEFTHSDIQHFYLIVREALDSVVIDFESQLKRLKVKVPEVNLDWAAYDIYTAVGN